MRLFNKMNKKGLQQVDWVVSIVIFVIYLVMFFIFIRPLVILPDTSEPMLAGLQHVFIENTTYEVERLPILVNQITGNENEPAIIEFPNDWNAQNVVASTGYFMVDQGRAIFFVNASKISEYYIANSENIREAEPEIILTSDENEATTQGFKVEFEEIIPNSYVYEEEKRIKSLSLTLDSSAYEKISKYKDHTSIASYLAAGNVNHTTYVFADNPATYSRIISTDHSNHEIELVMELYNYSYYYLDHSRDGTINYNLERCKTFDTDKIDFSDGSTGLLFWTSNESSIIICYNSSGLWMNATIPVGANEDVEYRIRFHNGGPESISGRPFNPVTGFKQTIESTSYAAISRLAISNYESTKAAWGVPTNHDFQIKIISDNYNTTIGPSPPFVDVFARTLRLFNYDGVDYDELQAIITLWGDS